MEDHPLLTTLSMDSFAHEMSESSQRTGGLGGGPPDINLPLSVEISPSDSSWGSKPSDLLDVGLLTSQNPDLGSLSTSYKAKRWVRRGDTIWGAWFFFNHYFRPALTEDCQNKLNKRDDGLQQQLVPLDKSDLRLDLFLVQHDMENMYMWTFKERPENALGKMQLRSYMNGHARFGDPQFPFSVDKGFARSHRMQRKHYRGLSNPQCVHGVEVVRSPDLSNVADDDKRRWMQLTGRDLNFLIAPEAAAFSEWRNIASTDFVDSEQMSLPSLSKTPNEIVMKHSSSKLVKRNGSSLNLTCHQLPSPPTTNLSLRPCVLIYDGICHLCNAGVRWVIHADRQKKISFCAVQSQAAKPYLTLCGLTEDDVLHRFLFVEGPGVSHQGSTAALKVASYLPVPYSVLTLFLVVPLPIRDAIYDYVAKHRYDWFGRSSDCIIPDDDILDRFVDKLEFQERAEQDDEDDEVN
ncbi:unnamed protein product [Sphagnum jensenii]|uniref:DUF8041 domain-containing protein n=1 Tax=Sphagnum jensenii TaxID=128206 RepID=A0ABP1AG03_9BRYO